MMMMMEVLFSLLCYIAGHEPAAAVCDPHTTARGPRFLSPLIYPRQRVPPLSGVVDYWLLVGVPCWWL